MRDAMTLKKHYPSRLHTHIVDVYELMNETYQCGMKQQSYYFVFYFYRYRIDDDTMLILIQYERDESEAPPVALDPDVRRAEPPP